MISQFVLLILEKVLEAVYFSLFLIFGKEIKNKRLLLIGIMVFQYLILTSFIEFNVILQITYTFLSFINLKVLYKEKAQITDIFLFAVASIILMLISIICVGTRYILNTNYLIVLILNRILLFAFLLLIKNKINYFYKKYYKNWNRKDSSSVVKIRSLTLRNISLIVFNLMFYIINIGLTYIILLKL